MKSLLLSNSPNAIKLSASYDSITIENIPNDSHGLTLMVFTKDLNGNEHKKEFFPHCSRLNYQPDIKFGKQSLVIYIKKNESHLFYSFLSDYDIILIKRSDGLSFEVSPIFASNGIFLNRIAKNNIFLKNCLLPTTTYQCEDIRIKKLALDITKGSIFDYGKVKAIHDWVAANIYYDRDSLINDRYIQMDKSGLGVLSTKRGVCSGFSNLTTSLLRAVGIPSIGVLCFTLKINTEGGWFNTNNLSHEPNHILSLAFINNRWMVMDVTWDSDNIFEDGCFKKQTGLGVSHKYFDVSIPLVSSTHKFVKFVY